MQVSISFFSPANAHPTLTVFLFTSEFFLFHFVDEAAIKTSASERFIRIPLINECEQLLIIFTAIKTLPSFTN